MQVSGDGLDQNGDTLSFMIQGPHWCTLCHSCGHSMQGLRESIGLGWLYITDTLSCQGEDLMPKLPRGGIHFMTSNDDCDVREYNMESFQLLSYFRFPWPFRMSIWEGYKGLDALFTAAGGSRVWLIPSVALRKLRRATVASFVSGGAHWRSPMFFSSESPCLHRRRRHCREH